ncbi:MAG: acetoacetate--CoA ligase [Gammaproteobacteria bacterium]|nr:acetoacetate--CoA ligase [Gammaproteobacteria bacterium]
MSLLWQPSPRHVESARITAFRRLAGERAGREFTDYATLHAWSISDRAAFWSAVWDFCGVIASQRGERALVDGDRMPGARFFPDARLNFAENLLRCRDDGDAIVFQCENGTGARLSWRELHDEVSRTAQCFRAAGIRPGDRIAAMLPNIPEAVVAALAAAAAGAVWSSCSPDFGAQGVLDRFRQIEPKLLITCDGYFYNGRQIDTIDNVREVAAGLPDVKQVLLVPFLRNTTGATLTTGGIPRTRLLAEAVTRFTPGEIEFNQLPFSHPLYILFSSGTTGLPKCIVHSAGGTLLQHLKEHQLHFDVRPDDRVFWFTTLGWMMWNWLVSALASEAKVLLFDGAPTYPDGNVLFDFADQERMTHLGVSAKYIQSIEKAGVTPARTHQLSALRIIGSTGSTLLPESFDYVYRDVKKDVCLSSFSGGTDIISGFVGGGPALPVHRGEIQARTLGMAVEIWNDAGKKLIGEKGELVCTRAFPSMPIGFWNDGDGARYRAAYFEKFPGVWAHGDYAEETPDGGYIIYGRSDATLNPGGVRIGTAELYRQVERFEEVVESVAVGQEWDGDTRIVLFVVLRDGRTLDEGLVARLKAQIRDGASPRHVPAKILQVAEIPRTRNGKITELAIRDVVHGRPVTNAEALANPQALEHFRGRAELQT